MTTQQPISDVVEKLEDATASPDTTLGDVLDEFGSAAYSSALLAVAVLLVSPLSGVPGFSAACGLTIFLIASQGAVARRSIWIPARLARLCLTSERAQSIVARIHTAAEWIDERSKARLAVLVSPPASRLLYAICAIAGLCLPFMELIPMTSSMLGLSVSLIAAGLLTRDGVISVVGLLLLPVVLAIVFTAFSTVLG